MSTNLASADPEAYPPEGSDDRRIWPFAALIGALIVLAWAGSLAAPFELDDHNSIVGNPSIRSLASSLAPPASQGETVGGRPVLNVSLALNYAVAGLDVRAYRATNIAIHFAAALLLFGFVARMLSRHGVRAGLRRHAVDAGFVVAVLWAVHPLQTQSVTYVIQRAESLMAFFYLLTLYGFIRAAGDAGRTGGRAWLVVSAAACVLGMGTKENMVSAPLAVLCADATFLAGSFRAALRERPRYYLALASSWIVLAALVVSTGGNRGGSSGFNVGVGWAGYALTQFPALTRYLSLSVWPSPLVFEYGAIDVTAGEAAGPAAILLGLVALTVVALWRWPRAGFIAALGFAVLAPTSLVPGTLQMIVEHRMYLPLASVLTLTVIAVSRLVPRRALVCLGVAMAGALALLTASRNAAYRSELALWTDTVAKRPANPRARNNLGLALLHAGRVDHAIAEFRRAIALQPNHAFAQANLGRTLIMTRDWAGAVAALEAALAADPALVDARVNLGAALTELGRPEEAAAQYAAALKDQPDAPDIKTNLAALLIHQRRSDEAVPLLREALARDPALPEAHYQLGRAREGADPAAAETEYRAALAARPDFGDAQLALGILLSRRPDSAGAEQALRRAMALLPGSAPARFALGNHLARFQRFDEAIGLYEQALALDPNHVQARGNLGNCLLALGRVDDAIVAYELALRQGPNEAVQRNLDLARQMAKQRGRR